MRPHHSRKSSEVVKIESYNSIKDQLQYENAALLKERQQIQNQFIQSNNYPTPNYNASKNRQRQYTGSVHVNSSPNKPNQDGFTHLLKLKISQIIQLCQTPEGMNQFNQIAQAQKSILNFLQNYNITGLSNINEQNTVSPQKSSHKKKSKLNKTTVHENKKQNYREFLGDQAMQLIQQIQRKALIQIENLRIDKINLMKRLNQQIKSHNQQKKLRIQLQQRMRNSFQNQNYRTSQRYDDNLGLGIVTQQNDEDGSQIVSNQKMMPISKQQPKNSGSFHSNNNRNSNHNLKNESNFTVTFQQQNTQGGSKKNLDNVNSTHQLHSPNYNQLNQITLNQSPQQINLRRQSQYNSQPPVVIQNIRQPHQRQYPQQRPSSQLRNAQQNNNVPKNYNNASRQNSLPYQNIQQSQNAPIFNQPNTPTSIQMPFPRINQKETRNITTALPNANKKQQQHIVQQINRLKQQNQRIKQQINTHPNLKHQLRSELVQLENKIKQYQELYQQMRNEQKNFNAKQFEDLLLQANVISQQGSKLLEKKKTIDDRTTRGSYNLQQAPRFSQNNNYQIRRERQYQNEYEDQGRGTFDQVRPPLQTFSPLDKQGFKVSFSPTQYQKLISQMNYVAN